MKAGHIPPGLAKKGAKLSENDGPGFSALAPGHRKHKGKHKHKHKKHGKHGDEGSESTQQARGGAAAIDLSNPKNQTCAAHGGNLTHEQHQTLIAAQQAGYRLPAPSTQDTEREDREQTSGPAPAVVGGGGLQPQVIEGRVPEFNITTASVGGGGPQTQIIEGETPPMNITTASVGGVHP